MVQTLWNWAPLAREKGTILPRRKTRTASSWTPWGKWEQAIVLEEKFVDDAAAEGMEMLRALFLLRGTARRHATFVMENAASQEIMQTTQGRTEEPMFGKARGIP